MHTLILIGSVLAVAGVAFYVGFYVGYLTGVYVTFDRINAATRQAKQAKQQRAA